MTDIDTSNTSRVGMQPTEPAKILGDQLAEVLGRIIEHFAPRIAPAIAAIEAGDYDTAEQVCADEEHVRRAADAVLERHGITEYHAEDNLGEAIIAMSRTSALDVLLEDVSPARIARYRSWCAERGVDPETGDIVDYDLMNASLTPR